MEYLKLYAIRSLVIFFGKTAGDTLVEGLVDSKDEAEFQKNLSVILKRWQELEECPQDGMAKFIDWFVKNKVDVIQTTMLRSIREDAGLGCPPVPFSTNASECVNKMLKNKVQYKRSELPQFISKLKELCDEQDREVERAIICRGKYRLRPQYQHLQVSETKWFTTYVTRTESVTFKESEHDFCV